MQGAPSRFREQSSAFIAGWTLPIGFVVVALALLMNSGPVRIPVESPAIVSESLTAIGPRREALRDPPTIGVEGREENCRACHQIFHSASAAGAKLSYHHDIVLSHGLNDRCVNCHDIDDRERLTLRDGTTIPFAETPLLCAQCHGTTYRDWQRGTHGKTLGSWITGSGAQVRLGCNECHDPHAPRYPAYEPLPGPRTLRMGEPTHDEAAHDRSTPRSPLRRWREAASGVVPGAAPPVPAHEP
ncbi:MAG: hypothetical protein FJ253_00185 [Phycisphaerae bacterium]|nr:hypothetical protein [Phycisphaerae bacterium]